jgi:tRNA(Ile)-lysidine synthase
LFFIRGAGNSALSTLPILHENIFRPLLLFTKSERESLLQELNFPIFQDESNLDLQYTRNRIRSQINPILFREGLNPDKLYWNFHDKEWVHSDTTNNSKRSYAKVYVPENLSISLFKKLIDTYLLILQLYPIKRKLMEEVYSQWKNSRRISAENVETFFWKSQRSPLYIIPKDSIVLQNADKNFWNQKEILLSENQSISSCREHHTIFYNNKHFKITELMRQRQIPKVVREFIPLILENGKVLRICFYLWDDNLSDFPKV